jgi:hypothetical protein
MWVPDDLLKCVGFLCVKGRERWWYGGTGFFVSVPTERLGTGSLHNYFVTARHCVEQASQYGSLYVRLNTTSGGADFIELKEDWYFPEPEGPDLAVSGLTPDPTQFVYDDVSINTFVTRADPSLRKAVGLGTDLITLGLFTENYGKTKNLPIVRQGTIAAFPGDPFLDDGGREYQAYLMESRSIGGLSGSPVFAVLGVDPVSWTPKQCGRKSERRESMWQGRGRVTPQSSKRRQSGFSGPAVARCTSWPRIWASRSRRFGTGSSKRIWMKDIGSTGSPPRNGRSCERSVKRTTFSGWSATS